MDRNIEDLLTQIRDELRSQSKETAEFRAEAMHNQKILMAQHYRQMNTWITLGIIIGMFFGACVIVVVTGK